MAGDLAFQPKAFPGQPRPEGWRRFFSQLLRWASAVPPGVDRRYGRFDTRANQLWRANYLFYPTKRGRLVWWRSMGDWAATHSGFRPALRQRLHYQFDTCCPTCQLDVRIDK